MVCRFLLLPLIGVAVTWAQDIGWVSGQVVDHRTGQPVEGVPIHLEPHSKAGLIREDLYVGPPSALKPAGTTNELGHFRVSAKPGVYRIHGLTDEFYGYFAGEQGISPSVAFALKAGETIEGVSIRLLRTASVSGIALGPNREPLAGTEVGLFSPPTAHQAALPYRTARTDSNGRFEFKELYPERLILGLLPLSGRAPAPSAPGGEARMWGYSYWPGTADPAAARVLDVKAGDRLTDMQITPVASPAFSVRGELTGEPGIVCPQIDLARDNGSWRPAGSRGKEASRTFNFAPVPAGRYELSLDCRGLSGMLYAKVHVEDRDVAIKVPVLRGRNLAWKVNLPRGIASVHSGTVQYQSSASHRDSFALGKPDLKSVLPGIYDFVVVAEDHDLVLDSVMVNGRVHSPRAVEIPAHTPDELRALGWGLADNGSLNLGSPIEITLNLMVGANVLVQSGKGVDLHYYIALIMGDGNGVLGTRWAKPDPSGERSIHAVPPGMYQFLAWRDGDDAPCDVDHPITCQGKTLPVKLEAGKQLRVTINQ